MVGASLLLLSALAARRVSAALVGRPDVGVAAVVWAGVIVLITELLSAFGHYSVLSIRIAAFVAVVGCILLASRVRNNASGAEPPARSAVIRREPFDRLFALVVAMFVGATGVLAVAWPPNTWDSMTYHLPRVMNWLQNGSVGMYEPLTRRQTDFPLLNGYLNGYLFGIAGNDRLLNLTQWIAYVVLTWLAFKLAVRLSGGSRGGWFAATMFAAMPMALAQASTTQADLVAALWPAVLLEYSFREQSQRFSSAAVEWFFVWIVVALSAMTKPTSLVATVPVGAVFLWRRFNESPDIRWSASGRWMAAGLLGVFAGSIPLYSRVLADGRWPDPGDQVVMSEPSLRGTLSNFVRFSQNNVGLPRELGRRMAGFFDVIYGFVGSEAGDPRYVGYGHSPSVAFGTNEDYAAQPLQFLVGSLAALALLTLMRHRRDLAQFAIVAIVQLILLVSFLKWNIWTNRLVLPVLFTLAVAVAVGLTVVSSGRFVRFVVAAIVVGAIGYGSLFLAASQYRSIPDLLFERQYSDFDRTFTVRPGFADDYRNAVYQLNRLPDGTEVVLVLPTGNSWEYPIWRFANEDFRLDLKFVTKVPGGGSREVVLVCVPECSG